MTAGEPVRVRLTRLEDGATWEGDLTPSRPQTVAGAVLADAAARRECDHAESLYGRCVACGLTWEQQARLSRPPLVIDGREASDHGTDDTDGTLADQVDPAP